MAWNTDLRWRLPAACLLLQVALVVLFGVFVRYDPDADAHWRARSRNTSSDLENEFYYRYPSKCGHERPAPRLPLRSPLPKGSDAQARAPVLLRSLGTPRRMPRHWVTSPVPGLGLVSLCVRCGWERGKEPPDSFV